MFDNAIFRLLSDEVEKTKRAYEGAKENFWAVAGKPRELPRIPTGLPHPDGSELIRRAVAQENFARKAHIEAIMRLNQYLLDGTIPEDVRVKSGRKTK